MIRKMRKERIFPVFAIILSATLLVSACAAAKTPITAGEFRVAAENAGYTVTEGVERVSPDSKVVITSQIAKSDTYEIKYLNFEDSKEATYEYNTQKGYYDKKVDAVETKELNSKNYSFYSYNSGEIFFIVARIDDTVIYCMSLAEYEDEIFGFIKSIGYQ